MKKDIKIDFKQLSADPRILVVIIAIACAALIGLCVYSAKQTQEIEKQLDAQVAVFNENKTAIENLLALKARSEQYIKQNEEYENLITSDGLDKQEFMIFFDKFCNQYGCRMTLIEFGEEGFEGDVKSLKFNITVEGDFEKLMAVCDGIVTQDRFYRIDAVTFTTGNDDKKVANINIVAFSK